MESFRRDHSNDMADHRPILKNKQKKYHPRFGFTPIPQNRGFVFTVWLLLTKLHDIKTSSKLRKSIQKGLVYDLLRPNFGLTPTSKGPPSPVTIYFLRDSMRVELVQSSKQRSGVSWLEDFARFESAGVNLWASGLEQRDTPSTASPHWSGPVRSGAVHTPVGLLCPVATAAPPRRRAAALLPALPCHVMSQSRHVNWVLSPLCGSKRFSFCGFSRSSCHKVPDPTISTA